MDQKDYNRVKIVPAFNNLWGNAILSRLHILYLQPCNQNWLTECSLLMCLTFLQCDKMHTHISTSITFYSYKLLMCTILYRYNLCNHINVHIKINSKRSDKDEHIKIIQTPNKGRHGRGLIISSKLENVFL